MSTSTRILSDISNNGFAPLEVYFIHDKEAPYRQAYEDFFKAPVFFNAEEYKIVLAREALNCECHQANPELAESIDDWMRGYLARFAANSMSLKVRRLLTEELSMGAFHQIDIARSLGISSRSIQRSLNKEGTCFTELLDRTRQDLALKYIEDSQLSILEICFLLGFSDQSNFTKAFKHWTGQTPYTYRQGMVV